MKEFRLPDSNLLPDELKGALVILKRDVVMKTLKHKSCVKCFVPKGTCTTYLQGAKVDDIEISQVGADVCVENISSDMKCQMGEKKNGN